MLTSPRSERLRIISVNRPKTSWSLKFLFEFAIFCSRISQKKKKHNSSFTKQTGYNGLINLTMKVIWLYYNKNAWVRYVNALSMLEKHEHNFQSEGYCVTKIVMPNIIRHATFRCGGAFLYSHYHELFSKRVEFSGWRDFAFF